MFDKIPNEVLEDIVYQGCKSSVHIETIEDRYAQLLVGEIPILGTVFRDT